MSCNYNHGTVNVYGAGEGLVNAAVINHSDDSKNYGAVYAESSGGQVTVNGILDTAKQKQITDERIPVTCFLYIVKKINKNLISLIYRAIITTTEQNRQCLYQRKPGES